ncbi:MAG: hypothetical protein QM687_07595 [Ferruginibacter sp.]
MAKAGTLRTCAKGHRYYKSSDCPVCPVCGQSKKTAEPFLAALSAPARRALEAADIQTLRQLSACSKASLLKLHGFGPASIPILESFLAEAGLSFRTK